MFYCSANALKTRASILATLIAFLGAALDLPAYAGPSNIPPKLEAFLSYPFLDELTAPKDGKRLAWIETLKGVRNVWIADGPDYKAKRLTSSSVDDGQELTTLRYSPNGDVLAWVRGGGENNPWADGLPAANPSSAPDQPQREIWISVKGSTPFKAGEGEAPVVSSTGRVAYLRENQVWVVDSQAGAKPAKLFYDRGKDASLNWSPDGSKLAFVSRRGDHSFVGVYGGADQPLVWLSPATAFDSDPVWSSDGERLAFARQEGASSVLTTTLVQSPHPFSIWIGSAKDGVAQAIWRSPTTPNGSFPSVPGGLYLMWATGERLTFRAELDGWPHLYSLPVAGGEPSLLTPGDYMVEHVSMAPGGRELFFDANSNLNEGDTDRRHLYSVAVDRPGPKHLTSGIGLEWMAVPLGRYGAVGFIGSTPTTAMQVRFFGGEKDQSRVLFDPGHDYSNNNLVVPKAVTFKAADGLLIHGQLFEPTPGQSPKPGLIFVHGGPSRQMLLGWSYMDYYAHAYAMNQYLASRGFVVLSVNYRLGVGYGRAFQHPDKGGIAGNSEYQDVLAAAHYLQATPGVDAARIGIWGGSYGGYLTGRALARNSDIFKVGVDFHGVHDWSLMPGEFPKSPQRFEQGDFALEQKTAFESSPEASIAGWRSPVLLIAGDDDRNVSFGQTVDLARRLSAQGTPFEELILPNEIHGFLRYDSWLRADIATVRFLEDHLKR